MGSIVCILAETGIEPDGALSGFFIVTYSTRIIGNAQDFARIRRQWDRLVEESRAGSLFMSWPWLMSAWQALSDEEQPIVVLFEQLDRLICAAAFVQRRHRYYGVPVRELAFLGDGISDRQEFLFAAGEEATLDAMWQFLAENPFKCDLVRLEQIPAASQTLVSGERLLRALETEPASTLAAMPLDMTWEAYHQSLPAALRRDLRQSERRLSEEGEWNVRHLHGPEILGYLPQMREIERRGYKGPAAQAFLDKPAHFGFLSAYLQTAPAESTVLTILEVDGRMAAYGLGFLHSGVYHGYNTSFDEDFKRAAPGKYVIYRSIRYACEKQLQTMDFLRGGSQLKSRFGGTSQQNMRGVLFYKGLKNAALRTAVFHVRPIIKSVGKALRWNRKNGMTDSLN